MSIISSCAGSRGLVWSPRFSSWTRPRVCRKSSYFDLAIRGGSHGNENGNRVESSALTAERVARALEPQGDRRHRLYHRTLARAVRGPGISLVGNGSPLAQDRGCFTA